MGETQSEHYGERDPHNNKSGVVRGFTLLKLSLTPQGTHPHKPKGYSPQDPREKKDKTDEVTTVEYSITSTLITSEHRNNGSEVVTSR